MSEADERPLRLVRNHADAPPLPLDEVDAKEADVRGELAARDQTATSPGSDDEGDVLEGEVVRVDQPYKPDPIDYVAELAARRTERSPLVPLWLRSRASALQVLKWQAEHGGYVLAYHALRTPKYAGKMATRSPAGLKKMLHGLVCWWFDLEGRPARRMMASRAESAEYLMLSRQRDKRVKARSWMLLVALIALAVVSILVAVAAPTWAHWAILGALVALAGIVGTPADKPLLDRAVIPARVQKLTSDIVVRALGSIGISELSKAAAKKDGIQFVAPIHRDGPGWRAEVDLPYGVTVAEVLEKRDKLASGLRRALGCVWPEPVSEEHPGRLVLWVGDEEMRKAKQPTWPLAKSGQISVFNPVPYGNDQRGRPVSILLMFANVLIGSMPRYGKTFALRVLLLACALDPLAELRLFELKGTGDLSALEKLAHHYAKGATSAAKEACVGSLAEVFDELERRAEVIDGLPRHLAPEFKVTPELAARKDLGLHPIVFAIDECQELFADEEFGDEAAKYATAIIKRGPALGVILILATQRPDKDSLPTGVSANAGIRICLRVMGQLENDMILGTSSYKAGIRATAFTMLDKGISWAVGIAEDPLIVRSAYLDGPTSERIAERAYQLRLAAGTLSGQAVGQAPAARPAHDLLADVLAVTAANDDKVWNLTAVNRLIEFRPDAYGQWAALPDDGKTAVLTAALKPYGIATGQVWGTGADGQGANRKGFVRAEVVEVHSQRA